MSPDASSDAVLADRRPGSFPRRALLVAALLLVVASLLGLPSGMGHSAVGAYFPGGSASTHVVSARATATTASVPRPVAAPAPAASVFNPPCYKIDLGVCVSICNVSEPDIIPLSSSFISSVEPNTTTDIPLCIKSQKQLDWPYAAHSGQKSPILLNVSAVLWNGDPYYSLASGDYWHSNNPTTVWSGPTQVTTNKSGYIWWYQVVISAKSSLNTPNFFPGETVTWWIELTYNQSNVYTHHESPHFQFTYAGAWPYSPYPGSAQYAGASATFEDINLTVTPRSPNWNDTVSLVLNTTQADALTNATIGSAWVDLVETAPSGGTIQSGTVQFPVTIAGGFGATTTKVKIPASFAQAEGATVSYWLTVNDVYSDQLTTPLASYSVGGNGSFLSGICIDDLNLETNPTSPLSATPGSAQLAPGQSLNISVTSRNLGTAISAAEAIETLTYPLLHETVKVTVPFNRVSSTDFEGSLTGLPVGTWVNFTIFAWDFTQRLESCPAFGYSTPAFDTNSIQGNSTFFYVFVYDNGSKTWVNGAKVQIEGPKSFYNSVSNTTLGVAYPNVTRNQYLPLLLPANVSYMITVTDPTFVPTSGAAGTPVNVTIKAVHTLNGRATLLVGPNYQVVQELNTIIFWLNTTVPNPPAAPPVPGGQLPIAGVVGLIASAGVAIPIAIWWRQIRARRKEEEKRVTL